MGTNLDCSLTLDMDTVALLGAGPNCRFKSATVLTVTLGSGASIMPAGTAAPDLVRLTSNGIGSAQGADAAGPTAQLSAVLLACLLLV